MSAPWIDLSAHNLALWRVGPDQDGLRLYVLRPIFSDMPHEMADLRTSANQQFVWDPDEGAYLLRIRPGQEKLPAPGVWLQAFPGALQRDRGKCTFNAHQPAMLDLWTLALANPWVWSNIDHPERCFANEEQALADGQPYAVLRTAVEVDRRMVRTLHTTATLDADPLPQEQDVNEEGAAPEDISPNESTASGETEANETGTSPTAREDYGDRIAGARKHAMESWLSNLRAQQSANQAGAATSDALKQMASTTRKDTLIGAKQQMADSLKDSPILAALWAAVNKEIPASVASTPYKARRGYIGGTNAALRRIVGYAEVVSAIGRRFEALRQNLTDETLVQAIFGDSMEPIPYVWRWQNIVPKDPYDEAHPLLSDQAVSDPTGAGIQPLRDKLDSPAYSLPILLSELSGATITTIRRSLVRSVLDAGFAIQQKSGDSKDLSAEFLLETNTIARIYNNAQFLRMTARGMDFKYFANFLSSDYFIQRGVDAAAWNGLNAGQKDQLMRDYFQDRADRDSQTMLAGLVKLPYTVNYYDKESVLDALHVDPADEKRLDEEPGYREFKSAEKRFLTTLAGAVLRHHARTADAAHASADNHSELVNDAITPDDPSDAEAGAPEKTEPDFLKWDTDNLLPLPNEPKGNSYRNGAETERGDKDVTEKELCDRFGFRGVQYGNWMTQKDRQEHLNAAFDSCCDLQDLMGFDDAAMVSLPRKRAGEDRQRLAIALGARGRGGRVAAHYEPDLHVINLTKTSGAGSLLHEWTHAADGYMGAECTGGQNILESNLAPSSWAKTPFAMFAKTLGEAPDTTTNASRAAVRMAIVRNAHPAMRKLIRETFLGQDVQQRLFTRLHDHLYSQWLEVNPTANGEARESARKETRTQAIALFEPSLLPMSRWVEAKIDFLDAAIKQDLLTPAGFPSSALNTAMVEHLANPFFRIAGRQAHYQHESAENAMREAFSLGPRPAASATSEPSEPLSGEALVAKKWAEACRGGFQNHLWKKLVGPIYNDTTVYRKALRKSASTTSQFLAEAKSLGEYWERPHELVARAVASIGYDALAARGVQNTYLTTSAPGRFSDPDLFRADPEPQGSERTAFAQAFVEKCLPVLRESLQSALNQSIQSMDTPECAPT